MGRLLRSVRDFFTASEPRRRRRMTGRPSWLSSPRAKRRPALAPRRRLGPELSSDPIEVGIARPHPLDLRGDLPSLGAIAVHDGHAESEEVAVVRVEAVLLQPGCLVLGARRGKVAG